MLSPYTSALVRAAAFFNVHPDHFPQRIAILHPLNLRLPQRHGPERDRGGGEMATEATEPIERWTVKRQMALVVSILKSEISVAEAARTHGLRVAEVEDWREKFLLGAQNALRSRPRDEEALKEEQIGLLPVYRFN